MSKQGYLFSTAGHPDCTDTFVVDCDECILISGVVSEPVKIQRRVGDKTIDGEYLYKDVTQNGVVLEVAPENCPVFITLPGYYRIEYSDALEGELYYEEVECKPDFFSLPFVEPKTVIAATTVEYFDPFNECCVPVLIEYCNDGTRVVRDLSEHQAILEEINMGTTLTPYKPAPNSEVCAQTQENLFELVPGTYTVADILAAVIAAGSLEFEFDGKAPIAVTADTVQKLSVMPKACGTRDSAGNEIVADFITVDGNDLAGYTDDEEGGVTLDAEIIVPDTGCALVDACFKLCVTKTEFVDLA